MKTTLSVTCSQIKIFQTRHFYTVLRCFEFKMTTPIISLTREKYERMTPQQVRTLKETYEMPQDRPFRLLFITFFFSWTRNSTPHYVGPLICPSVGPSVRCPILPSVHPILLPNSWNDLKHNPCPPARDWDSTVSGLVFFSDYMSFHPFYHLSFPLHPPPSHYIVGSNPRRKS